MPHFTYWLFSTDQGTMADQDFVTFVKRQGIIAMFSDDVLMDHLVLKGGNAMDLIYQVSTRASVDLDFSIDGDFDDVEELRRRVEQAIVTTFQAEGFVAFDIQLREVPPHLSEDMQDFWGGYKISFKLIEKADFDQYSDDLESLRRHAASVGARGSTKFTIDMSRHEFCGAKQEYELHGFTIWVYTPACFAAEKLRALCQQRPNYVSQVRSHRKSRAQDVVDIHVVANRFRIDFGVDDFHELVQEIFRAKKVPLSLIGEIDEDREPHRESFDRVLDTVNPSFDLREFDFYFDELLRRCGLLEPLWNP